VLERWYKAVMPLLKTYYGTGGDLNVDEIHEVIPITEKLGLFHPQEGVVNGHFKVDAISTKKRLANLTGGVSKKLTDLRFIPADDKNLVTADMITGYGVAEAVRHYYGIWGGNVNMKRAIIQGWGNVGAAAAYYLSLYGVMIVGIIDRNGGLINNTGFTKDEIKELFLNKQGNTLVHPDMLSYEEVNAKIWDIGAEIFVPAAASRLLTKEQVDRMVEGELEVISCGANVPFADEEIFMGAVANYTDDQVAVIPDFIANCGMARVFAYCQSNDEVDLTDEAIFKDSSKVIWQAMMRLHQFNPKHTGLLKKGLEMTLVNLVK
jgi:glutamate dehydrogenase/leucine dehydrogenase